MRAADLPDPVIIAASRWLVELQYNDVSTAAKMFRAVPRYRDLTPTQYQLALDWLRGEGLVDASRLVLLAPLQDLLELLVVRVLDARQPAWLDEVDEFVSHPEDVPIDIADIAESIGLDDDHLLDGVKGLARKYDDARMKEIGHRGEELFVDWLAGQTSAQIDWVSESDDSAGYDIVISNQEFRREIEVKTTVSADRVRFYLSRNEYERLCISPVWLMQIIVLEHDLISSMYSVSDEWIHNAVPKDAPRHGRWQSARLTVPRSSLIVGTSPLLTDALSVAD